MFMEILCNYIEEMLYCQYCSMMWEIKMVEITIFGFAILFGISVCEKCHLTTSTVAALH